MRARASGRTPTGTRLRQRTIHQGAVCGPCNLAQLPVFLDDFGAAKVIQLGERIEIAGVAMVISLKF
jgi:hypothetical protein